MALAIAGVGAWAWDLTTNEVDWDDTCGRLFGHPGAGGDLGAAALIAHVDPIDLPDLRKVMLAAASNHSTGEATVRAVHDDGEVHHILCRCRHIADENGERVIGATLDVTELRRAAAAEMATAKRVSSLSAVALTLSAARTIEDVVDVAMGAGFSVLGAARTVLAVTDVTGQRVRVWRSGDDVPDEIKARFTDVSIDMDLPSTYTARTGRALFLRDFDAVDAIFPKYSYLALLVKAQALAVLPMAVSGRVVGSLMVTWQGPRDFTDDDREMAFALSAQTAQALDRVLTGAAERRVSESLQRSMLVLPPRHDDLTVEVRYRPAAHSAQVGGDWYDAFSLPGGDTVLVIGDVVGHDVRAAGVMGQVRTLLRGIAYDRCATSAEVLSRVDRAMHGLHVPTMASCLIMRVEPADDQLGAHGAHGRNGRRVRWSNAGHLPPLLVCADGDVRVLDTDPELLLGVDPSVTRRAHETRLLPGDTLLLYTDGLVERRDADLTHGIDRLAATLAQLVREASGPLPLDVLCDDMLSRMLVQSSDDDVAVIGVRAND